jgi:hypothetical protein
MVNNALITEYLIRYLLGSRMLWDSFDAKSDIVRHNPPFPKLIKLPRHELQLNRAINGSSCCKHYIPCMPLRKDDDERMRIAVVYIDLMFAYVKVLEDYLLQLLT